MLEVQTTDDGEDEAAAGEDGGKRRRIVTIAMEGLYGASDLRIRACIGLMYWKAVGRGTLGLPAGAVVNVFGAVALGAPVGVKYVKKRVQ